MGKIGAAASGNLSRLACLAKQRHTYIYRAYDLLESDVLGE